MDNPYTRAVTSQSGAFPSKLVSFYLLMDYWISVCMRLAEVDSKVHENVLSRPVLCM